MLQVQTAQELIDALTQLADDENLSLDTMHLYNDGGENLTLGVGSRLTTFSDDSCSTDVELIEIG